MRLPNHYLRIVPRFARQLLDLYHRDLLAVFVSSKEALAKSIGETLADRFYHAIRKQPKLAKATKDNALYG